MANRRPTEMNVEVVIGRKLTMTVGQIREAPAEMKEQWIGVDARFPTEIEFHPVTGTEVDELRKTRESREIDQVLPWKISRQRGGGELIDPHGAI
jgi:hypothetical protein